MAILWREKRGIHVAPAEGNFINEQESATSHRQGKRLIVLKMASHTRRLMEAQQTVNVTESVGLIEHINIKMHFQWTILILFPELTK
jgi:desulfoferrodoxin (superoxide reductase-like protein)